MQTGGRDIIHLGKLQVLGNAVTLGQAKSTESEEEIGVNKMSHQNSFVNSSLVERPGAKDWFEKFQGFVEEHPLGK